MDSNVYQKYKEARMKQNYSALLNIESICRRLQASQQVIATAMMIAHKYLFVEHVSTDCAERCTVSILLAFKINDVHQSLEDIMVEVAHEVGLTPFDKKRDAATPQLRRSSETCSDMKTRVLDQELLFCIYTNFEFSYINYYEYLFTKLQDFELSRSICNIAHIILNDVFYLPLFLFYNRRSIVYSVLYLAIEIEMYRTDNSMGTADHKIAGIRSFLSTCRDSDTTMNIIITEVLDLYQRFCE